MIEKLSGNAVRFQARRGNILILNKTMSKVSINISGPRGGAEQTMLIDGDDLLEMLDAVGGISSVAAGNFDICLDGCCRVCEDSVNEGETICCDCLNGAIARHKNRCPAYYHEDIVA